LFFLFKGTFQRFPIGNMTVELKACIGMVAREGIVFLLQLAACFLFFHQSCLERFDLCLVFAVRGTGRRKSFA
jgi:hypothetical protein